MRGIDRGVRSWGEGLVLAAGNRRGIVALGAPDGFRCSARRLHPRKLKMDLELVTIGHILNETIVFLDKTISPVLGSPAAYPSVVSSKLGVRTGIAVIGSGSIAEIVKCISEDKEPLISGEDGAKVIEILCAVFKSMEIDSWVELPLKEEVVSPYYKAGTSKALTVRGGREEKLQGSRNT